MGLILNTASDRTVEITNLHEVFEGKPYSEVEFSITLAPITSTQRAELARKFTKGGTFDDIGFLKALWGRTVKDWSGISFGADDVPCTRESKDTIIEHSLEFAELVMRAARGEFEKTAAHRAEEERGN